MTSDNTIQSGQIPIPRTLETPPRTTGNAQFDFPLMIDWMYRAYLVIVQSVAYINQQVQENPNLSVTDLPDPGSTTLAQAQLTANLAYALADQANNKADALDPRLDTAEANITTLTNRLDGFITDTFTISEAFDGVNVTFGTAQPDANYTIVVQPISFVGTPSANAFIVKEKTYSAADFSVTMYAAPGIGNSVTFEWRLIRNS